MVGGERSRAGSIDLPIGYLGRESTTHGGYIKSLGFACGFRGTPMADVGTRFHAQEKPSAVYKQVRLTAGRGRMSVGGTFGTYSVLH